MKEPLVIATGNPHKVKELRAIFAERGIEVVGLGDLGIEVREPEETGATFEENASIKALSYAAQTGRVCLADDSGLEVDALRGAPGVISSHYSTGGVETGLSRAERDAANNARLMRELEGVPREGRVARFVCVMSVAGVPRGAGFEPAPRLMSAKQTFDGEFCKSESGLLPHWQVKRATYFVTFRLLSGILSEEERGLVCDACLHWHGTRLVMHLAVVMPDHVHMIFRPLQQADGSWPTLPGIMHSIKRHTAREINLRRGSSGPLWQEEYFDRIMRGWGELRETSRYAQLNPVRAGLVSKPGHYAYMVRGERSRSRLQTGSPNGRAVVSFPDRSRLQTGSPIVSVMARARGTFEGRIGMAGEVPRGENGFGYDPLFMVEDGKTSAELSEREKNARSHRGAAAREIARLVSELG